MRVTIREIAKAVNMSPSTVSQALNNKGQLTRDTRMKVRQAARKMGYYLPDDPFGINPVITGRPVRLLFAGVRGAIDRDQIGRFASDVLEGVDEALKAYHTELVWMSEDDMDNLPSGTVGTLVIGGSISDEMVTSLEACNEPVITIGSHVKSSLKLGAVLPDAVHSIGLAVSHLYQLGHRKIVLLNGPLWTRTSDDKLTGFLRACHYHGISSNRVYTFEHPWDVKYVTGRVRALFKRPGFTKATAFVCSYEALAVAVSMVAKETGRRIPEDLSVIGYHDEGLSERATPPITALSLPLRKMGRLAAINLVAASENSDLFGLRIVLPASLTLRESTGPAPMSPVPPA